MAQLGADLVGAAEDLAVNDHPAADARAEGQQDHVGALPPRPAEELAEPGGVGVVLQRHGDAAELAGDPLAQADLDEAVDVGRGVDDALGHAQRPRAADAHAQHVAAGQARLADGLFGALGDAVDDGPGAAGRGGELEDPPGRCWRSRSPNLMNVPPMSIPTQTLAIALTRFA